MCGIVGYIGSRSAREIIINGLKRLEYRGYDSAGVAIFDKEPQIFRCKGRVKELEEMLNNSGVEGTTGIGHTRWATHGEPNELNAHPQVSYKGNFIVVHNGIIENYDRLKKHLENRGIIFTSQTDTEVIANLMEHLYLEGSLSPEQAIIAALGSLEGAYGLAILCPSERDRIYAAKLGSPLVIGVGDGENFIASDATPIVEYTQKVIYMRDDDLAIIKKNELTIKTLRSQTIQPEVKEVDIKIGEVDMEGFPHFMLKEIFEQPRAIHDTCRGRILPDHSGIMLGGLHEVITDASKAEKIIIIACGTSWHAGLLGEYIFEEYTRIPVEVEYASEFRYRNPVINKGDIVIAISQSGETADTLAAIKLAREKGAKVLGICNVVGSSIPRETDAGVYTHAGPEIGVASTKAFTTQVTVLAMMAFEIGHRKGIISDQAYRELIDELVLIPSKMEMALQANDKALALAEIIKDSRNALYLGRGYLFPVALEGALKLKEISYIHAEGYPAAEMKHGPIALIDENMPVVVVATRDSTQYPGDKGKEGQGNSNSFGR